MAERKPANDQKTFEFDYSAWCRALERHRLPYKAQELCKIVKTFDQGNGCWASLDSITGRCREKHLWRSRNTTKEWLAYLQGASFLTIEKDRVRENHSQTTNLITINDRKIFDDPPAIAPMGGSKVDRGGVKSWLGGDQKLTPQNYPSLNLLKSKTHGHGDDGISRNERTTTQAVRKVNWRRPVTLDDLRDLPTVQELFGIAVAQGFRRDTFPDLLAFAGLAIVAREKRNPGGFFTDAVSFGWYSFVKQADEDRANAALKRERQEVGP